MGDEECQERMSSWKKIELDGWSEVARGKGRMAEAGRRSHGSHSRWAEQECCSYLVCSTTIATMYGTVDKDGLRRFRRWKMMMNDVRFSLSEITRVSRESEPPFQGSDVTDSRKGGFSRWAMRNGGNWFHSIFQQNK